tara:strand:+ start:117 stop:320 length:204 start_codon:yes stop_codon:yes gene_type:complete
MKIGDLVMYIESDMGGSGPMDGHEGLVLDGPREHAAGGPASWEIFWMYCNKTGWWDEYRLEVIDEAR